MNTEPEMTSQELKTLKRKVILRFSLFPFLMAAIFLLSAGTFNYWQAYTYIGILAVPMVCVVSYFMKRNPKFLERRLRMKEKEKPQKFVVFITTFCFIIGFLLPGLDIRYAWSNVSVTLVIIADVLVLAGYLFVIYVFRENNYASRIIEVSEEQKVITTGPYRIVRHPMYLGVLLMYLSTPIALGSWWAVIPFAVVPFIFILRILNEEKVLSENLEGYKEYCGKTRYRLFPYIW